MDQIDRPAKLAEGDEPRWGSDLAALMLRQCGVHYISLNPGASFRGFHDSLVNFLGNRDPQLLLCLHEDHAVSIAHGYAKVTDEPMACFLHSNVGLMHGLMGIYNAWCDRAPVVVLGANGPVVPEARRPWIDWIHTTKDAGALLRNFVKWDDEPRSQAAIPEAILRATAAADLYPKAPTYVCLEVGLQEARIEKPITLPNPARRAQASDAAVSADVLERAADLLANARNCVVLFGRGSRRQDDWDRRVAFVELLECKALTSILQRAVFPTDHPLHPVRPFYFLPQPAAAMLGEADVILSLDWVDLNGLLRQVTAEVDAISAKVVHVSLDHILHNGWGMDHFGSPETDMQVSTSPDTFVRQILPMLGERAGRRTRTAFPPREMKPAEHGPQADEFLTIFDLEVALARVGAPKPLTLAHAASGWSGEVYPFRGPLDFLGGDGGGGLSSGPGLAAGAALALKDSGRIVVTVLGDGDTLQGISALWTASHYGLPVLYIVANNRSNFNDEIHQETVARNRNRPPENRWIGQRIDDPAIDFVKLAEGQGVQAIGPVCNSSELEAALAAGFSAVSGGAPFLIDVRIRAGYATPIVTGFGEASDGRQCHNVPGRGRSR